MKLESEIEKSQTLSVEKEPVIIMEMTDDGPKYHKFYGDIKILNKEASKLYREKDNASKPHNDWAAIGENKEGFKPPLAVPKDITAKELQMIEFKR
jgi:hypothetical protein